MSAKVLAPLGVTALDMPATSEKVWAAIRAAERTRADAAGGGR